MMGINYESTEWRIRGHDIKIQKRLNNNYDWFAFIVVNDYKEVLTKNLKFIPKPLVDDMTETFKNATRFRTFDDALKHVEKYLEGAK